MNVVLTGATGFVGSEALSQLLAHPDVQRVTCLVRRPLRDRDRDGARGKLVEIVHDDFSRYDDALLERLADHGACIWALGGKASDFSNAAEYERVTHDFTLAFAEAMAARGGPFAFCYVSGMGADRDGTSILPWERATRCAKGRTEKDLLALHDQQPAFAPMCFRPGGILPRGDSRVPEVLFGRWVIRVDGLARALIRAALLGEGATAAPRTLENKAIGRLARAW